MTPDQSRIEADRAEPRVALVWRALTALRTPLTFMQSGAHPDDEISDMLAALRFRDGIGLAYVCSTRGEGGQNDIGTESGAALGVLRTAEMERAAERLDMRLRWLTPRPGDPVHDFGFSKSGEETLERWGRARTLERFAAAIRAERPDILCPTFLDVPGQHGHHRAMTLLAPEAVRLAADEAWRTDLPPWRVAKLYLPAWSGAGTSYDDEAPPPPATVTVPASGRCPVTGWPFARIGQQSRAMHRTQGMGRWTDEGRDLPLHLVDGGPEGAVTDGLPGWEDVGAAEAGAAMAEAVAAFPDPAAIRRHAARALGLLPEGGPDAHRFERARAALARVLWLASGAEARGAAGADWIEPDAAVPVSWHVHEGEARDVSVALALPEGWSGRDAIRAARPADPYPDAYDPLRPPLPALDVRARVEGARIALRLPLDRTPAALPPSVTVAPERDVATRARPEVPVRLSDGAALAPPEGASFEDGVLRLPPSPGLHEIPVTLGGAPALTARRIRAPHTAPRVLTAPALLRVAVIDVEVPQARIGYVGAGRDRVARWLGRIGADVAEIGDAQLADAGALAAFDTILIGIFAMRFRPGLAAAMPAIRARMRAGAHLVTLYHRPWDDWEAAGLPLRIGQPSLRWRVTDPGAEVTMLEPEHPLMAGPNRIGPQDWRGWHKERGLYFASGWGDGHAPLLSMSDPGEAPLEGALVSGRIGEGRHTHCALILHHQMEALVPGAFRLMANLVQRA